MSRYLHVSTGIAQHLPEWDIKSVSELYGQRMCKRWRVGLSLYVMQHHTSDAYEKLSCILNLSTRQQFEARSRSGYSAPKKTAYGIKWVGARTGLHNLEKIISSSSSGNLAPHTRSPPTNCLVCIPSDFYRLRKSLFEHCNFRGSTANTWQLLHFYVQKMCITLQSWKSLLYVSEPTRRSRVRKVTCYSLSFFVFRRFKDA
jgi:hypothetical protein